MIYDDSNLPEFRVPIWTFRVIVHDVIDLLTWCKSCFERHLALFPRRIERYAERCIGRAMSIAVSSRRAMPSTVLSTVLG